MITYTPLPLMFGEGVKATYKSILATLYPTEKGMMIYTIESKNQHKGECREFLELLKKDYPKIVSSIPLNRRWEKICELNDIEIIK